MAAADAGTGAAAAAARAGASGADAAAAKPAQRAARQRRSRAGGTAKGSATKEKLIAFRPREGTRARLDAVASGRSISQMLQLAVDAYLGRKVPQVDPVALQQVLADLAATRSAVWSVRANVASAGNCFNQVARFVNSRQKVPLNIAEELRRGNDLLAEAVSTLERIEAAVLAQIESAAGTVR